MVFIMKIIEMFGLVCLRIFGGLIGAVSKAAGDEFTSATTAGTEERKALYQAEREAVSRLAPEDQALMWFADGKITQARAAKRKFWKESDAVAYAKLYAKLGYNEQELNYAMTVEERMPGYFRNKVRAALANLK